MLYTCLYGMEFCNFIQKLETKGLIGGFYGSACCFNLSVLRTVDADMSDT